MRIPSRIFAFSLLAIILAFAAVVFISPRFLQPGTHPETRCLSNLKLCIMASLEYSSENDEHLPIAASWMDEISGHLRSPELLNSPMVDRYGYAMVFGMSTVQTTKVKDADKTPVLFDSILLARNATSGFYGFPDPNERKTHVSYLDGHVTSLKPAQSKGRQRNE